MMTSDQVVDVLRHAWPSVDLIDQPQAITGGQWATICRVHLAGHPAGVPDHLVLRVAPQAEMAAKEQAVQGAVARAGVPTPRIHLTGPAGGPLGGAWALMDLAPGAPLLADLDGVAALGRLPRILGRLPRHLADTMAAIHRLDPRPILERVRADAPTVALTIDKLWPHLHAAAAAAARPDLTDALHRLAASQPQHDDSVLCHGDLHPLNLLAAGPRITVLDWTGAIVAPAAFDVAFTRLLLRHPPLAAPPALRSAISAGGAALARRFTRRYQNANPAANLGHLAWYTALHAARILTDHATWTRTGDPRAQHHPFRLLTPAATRALARITGNDDTVTDLGGRDRT